MTDQQLATIRYLSFDIFAAHSIRHAIFTRLGGQSVPPWGSLNFGYKVGDDLEKVQANHQLAFSALGLDYEKMVDVAQVHGMDVHVVESASQNGEKVQADAIITNQPGVPLLMRFADCTPILLYDPINRIAGLAHAGWRGTVAKVAAETVGMMARKFGSTPKDILAGIGPSICASCYEVGAEVTTAVARAFGEKAESFLRPYSDTSVSFDLARANAHVLRQAGVEQIEVADICTAETPGEWFSHRGEHGRTGRFAAVIAIQQEKQN